MKKIDNENKPFLIEGKLKSFTSPKSSPVAQTCRLKQASAELTSFIEVYFGQIPFTSGPRTEVHVDHFIVDMTSASKSCWPPVQTRARTAKLLEQTKTAFQRKKVNSLGIMQTSLSPAPSFVCRQWQSRDQSM